MTRNVHALMGLPPLSSAEDAYCVNVALRTAQGSLRTAQVVLRRHDSAASTSWQEFLATLVERMDDGVECLCEVAAQ